MSSTQVERRERGARAGVVGTHVRRLDSRQKVDGTVDYTDDLDFEGYHAVLVRSSVPHGEIVSVDTAAAEATPGVRAVVTGRDLDKAAWITPFIGQVYQDQPLLAVGKTRFAGEPVVAVVAKNRDIAQEAAAAVDVEYNPLPPVDDVRTARDPDTPHLHTDTESSKFFDDVQGMRPSGEPNDAYTYSFDIGDCERGFDDADHVFESTYSTPMVQHMHLEPYVAFASYDAATDSYDITTGNQVPHFLKREVARIFDVAEAKVRIQVPQVGGSYGSKTYARIEPLTAALARIAGNPVKLRQNLAESFDTAVRDGSVVTVKTGVTDAGSITAREIEILWDSGAYAEVSPRKTKKAGYTSPGPYEIDNLSIRSKCTYTSKPPAVPYRGFGVPQTAWAIESHMDDIADALGLSPYEIRTVNLIEDEGTFNGGSIGRTGIKDVVEEMRSHLAADLPEADESHLARGRGSAITLKSTLSPSNSEAIALLNSDGSLNVVSASVKIGQGTQTTMAQIAADELGVDLDRVSVNHVDTSVAPFDTSTTSSRSTFHMGNAVTRAIREIESQLCDAVDEKRDVDRDALDVSDGAVILPTGDSLPIGSVMKDAFIGGGGTLIGRGQFSSEETGPGYFTLEGMIERDEYGSAMWMTGGTIVDVTVDTRTGAYDIDRWVNVGDAGAAIDPERVKGQFLGAALHGLGHATSEQMIFENGQQINKTLLEYKIPSIADMPDESETVIVESHDPNGPHGAKGIGETHTITVPPALGNAIKNATGGRVYTLPVTPEKVLEAVDGTGGER